MLCVLGRLLEVRGRESVDGLQVSTWRRMVGAGVINSPPRSLQYAMRSLNCKHFKLAPGAQN